MRWWKPTLIPWVVGTLTLSSPWHAAAGDPELFGDGSDGPLVVDGTTVRLSEYVSPGRSHPDGAVYRMVEDLPQGTTTIPLEGYDQGALEPGCEVLIIAIQGTQAQYDQAGYYEFHTVASDSASSIEVTVGLTHAFPGTSYQILVLRVPHYTTVTVSGGGTLTTAAWDGTTGGVVAFRASESVSVSDGLISANELGFRGGEGNAGGSSSIGAQDGESVPGVGIRPSDNNPNLGGGGASGPRPDSVANGGGGGYGTAGGNGNSLNDRAGTMLGGVVYGTADLSRIYLGSGGGSGLSDMEGECNSYGPPGGRGGGILLFASPLITVSENGAIASDGEPGHSPANNGCNDDGAGGGGSGGSVFLTAIDLTLAPAAIHARGAEGGTGVYNNTYFPAGGAGGVGRIRVDAASLNGQTAGTTEFDEQLVLVSDPPVGYSENIDSDGDGVPESSDNCPDTPNTDQADIDSDGLGDACDEDDDNDSVIDLEDNCPDMPNTDQADHDADTEGDACDLDADDDGVQADQDCNDLDDSVFSEAVFWEDADADGLGDPEVSISVCQTDPPTGYVSNNLDTCPEVADPANLDSDGDGLGNACDDDDDDDQIPDSSDNCPLVPNPDQEDTDGNGTGDLCEADLDGDGIADATDNCPENANTEQEDLDEDGVGDACDEDVDGDEVPGTEDCDDEDPEVAATTTFYADEDEDGWGDPAVPIEVCGNQAPAGYVEAFPDNCPEEFNPDQEDLDGDGEGDRCDRDLDGDGVDNPDDNCPTVDNPDQEDTDHDGEGDACDPSPDLTPTPSPGTWATETPGPEPSSTPWPTLTPSPEPSATPTAEASSTPEATPGDEPSADGCTCNARSGRHPSGQGPVPAATLLLGAAVAVLAKRRH